MVKLQFIRLITNLTRRVNKKNAGVEGIEPPNVLLESTGIPLTYTPIFKLYHQGDSYIYIMQEINTSIKLFNCLPKNLVSFQIDYARVGPYYRA